MHDASLETNPLDPRSLREENLAREARLEGLEKEIAELSSHIDEPVLNLGSENQKELIGRWVGS